MPFVLGTIKRRSAVDIATDSTMLIITTPQIEFYTAKFSSPEFSSETAIVIRPKFPEKQLQDYDIQNPRIMISARDINRSLITKKMYDIENNTKIVDKIIRMIAFINKKFPLSPSPFIWSDYSLIQKDQLIYKMASDEELITISQNPDHYVSSVTGE